MQRKKLGVDIIDDVLQAALVAYPASEFIKSLLFQYQERGGLSKKQLEGLYAKAKKITELSPAKLATLEAEILKRPNRFKSVLPPNKPLYEKDEESGKWIEAILAKYPQHKRVLYFKMKYDGDEPLSSTDIAELKKFHSLLIK
jgi:hypothetical protein